MLIKIIPHHGESVYKCEFSHLHMAIAGVAVLALSGVLLLAHVADVHSAEARVRTLQVLEAKQKHELKAFSEQTNMLWQRVGKLQRDNEEIHRLTKVIVPKTSLHPARKAVTHTGTRFSAVSKPSSWHRAIAWVRSLSGLDEGGFAAEAAELSSLARTFEETDRQSNALVAGIRVVAQSKIAAALARERYLAAIPSLWPTLGYVSSGFGYRSYPDSEFHPGLDIVNDYGAPVYATASGIVSKAGWDGGFGYEIVIDHGNGFHTMYAHNSRLLVAEGQVVTKGQQIANVGSSGFATGPHVHYQVELWGKPVDPTPYLSGSVKVVAQAE